MTVRPPGAPALQSFRYFDIDQYRQAVRSIDVDFTPLSRRISAHQTVLHLRGCDINLIRSFPRLLDAELARNCTSVGFTMDDRFPIRFNGVENDRSLLALGHGGAGYKSLEGAATQFASIMFTPEIKGRGWPAIGRQFAIFAITRASQQRLRDLVREVVKFAGESPDALQVPGTEPVSRNPCLPRSTRPSPRQARRRSAPGVPVDSSASFRKLKMSFVQTLRLRSTARNWRASSVFP